MCEKLYLYSHSFSGTVRPPAIDAVLKSTKHQHKNHIKNVLFCQWAARELKFTFAVDVDVVKNISDVVQNVINCNLLQCQIIGIPNLLVMQKINKKFGLLFCYQDVIFVFCIAILIKFEQKTKQNKGEQYLTLHVSLNTFL